MFAATLAPPSSSASAVWSSPFSSSAWRRNAFSAAALALLPTAARGEVPLASLSNGPAPTAQELGRRSSNELKALLRTKGVSCNGCSEKAHVVQRVLETWDNGLLEATSPDGKIQLTKEIFVQNLKRSYKKHLVQTSEEGGHELAEEEEDEDGDEGAGVDPGQLPDFDQVWAEFSAKLAKGEVETDSNGQVVYQVGQPKPAPSFWDRWKTNGLIIMNVSMLGCTQYLKRWKPRELPRDGQQGGAAQPGDALDDFESEEEQKKKHTKKKKEGKKKS